MHNVLIVEDTEMNIRLLEAMLDPEDHRLHIARTLAESRTLLETLIPDVILLDLRLPDGNGLELCSFLKEQGLDLPVIVISAYDKRTEAMAAGCNSYLMKPVNRGELIKTIKKLVTERLN